MKAEGVESQHASRIDLKKRHPEEFENIGYKDKDDTSNRPILWRTGFLKKNTAKHHDHTPKCR